MLGTGPPASTSFAFSVVLLVALGSLVGGISPPAASGGNAPGVAPIGGALGSTANVAVHWGHPVTSGAGLPAGALPSYSKAGVPAPNWNCTPWNVSTYSVLRFPELGVNFTLVPPPWNAT